MNVFQETVIDFLQWKGFEAMSISKLNKLSPLHGEIVKTINNLSLFGFELTQGPLELKVSSAFAEDLNPELVDGIFSVLWSVVTNKKRTWTLDLNLLPVELDTLRISFSRTDPFGTFQVAFFQIFYDVVVESLVFNFNPRKPSQSLVLFNTKEGIVLTDVKREATEEEIIAGIRKFISENFAEAVRKDAYFGISERQVKNYMGKGACKHGETTPN